MEVTKRNGTKEAFDFNKIKIAVNKAFNAVYKNDAPNDFIDYLETITSTLDSDKSVEEIQNIVEDALMEFKWFDVAREYIKYRDKHNSIRS